MEDDLRKFFLNPTQVTQRRYEALRALCVEKVPAREVAERFGYSVFSINALKRDFAKAVKGHAIDATHFFRSYHPGRKEDAQKGTVKETIVALRKQNYSILDIKGILHAEGHLLSHDSIHRVLTAEGFARLPKRTQRERKHASLTVLKAPRSKAIDWADDKGKIFHAERGIGVLPFLPLLASLGADRWITEALYPESQELTRTQSVLSFLALKLAGHTRYSQDDLWAMDRGFGLMAGLNVLPKDSTLSSYSYRTSRTMNRTFLKAMFASLEKRGLVSGQVNLDFTAIPHWGDASVLENNWSGKRGRALKSVLAALCQDPDTGIFCYADAEVKHRDQAECVLQFVDFWKEHGTSPSCLIFDSRFTTYQNLERLDRDGIRFITLRRRSKKLLDTTQSMPKEEWKIVTVEGRARRYERVRVHESEIRLPRTKLTARQIIIADHGRARETFLITNDRKLTPSQIIRNYARRWNVEKGIAEPVGFFHLNSLSSSIVVKVDFDLTMTIAAHNVYRIMALKLVGFEKESSSSLNSKFFTNGGQCHIGDDSIIIEMKKKRHLPLLLDALSSDQEISIPWLGDRKLVFRLWATS